MNQSSNTLGLANNQMLEEFRKLSEIDVLSGREEKRKLTMKANPARVGWIQIDDEEFAPPVSPQTRDVWCSQPVDQSDRQPVSHLWQLPTFGQRSTCQPGTA